MKTAILPSTQRSSLRSGRSPRPSRVSKRLQLRSILVPIDFSTASLEAIDFALTLSKQFGAPLHFAHVFAPDYPLASMATLPLIVPNLQVGRNVRRHLKDVVQKFGVALPPQNIHALKGQPFREICEFAHKTGIDLIVMATRGQTGLKHLVLGSTAERVVRYSSCPVLVVGPSPSRKTGGNGKLPRHVPSFRKILVPIDFSACSRQALEDAKALAQGFNSTLVLFHAVHPQYYVTSDEYTHYDLPLLMEATEKAARDQMADLARNTDWEGIKIKTSLQFGHPGEEICLAAKREGADLIVTSTHGRTGFKHVLIGSTAEYVVRHAGCPTLVVPSHLRSTFISNAA